jgi:CubicO group peptidase (beta-lactamase class C family)
MKTIKNIILYTAAIILLFEMGLWLSGNLFVNSVLRHTIFSGKMGPDIDELDLFPKHEIATQFKQPWPHSNRNVIIDKSYIDAFQSYETESFLVIKDDSIVLEWHEPMYNPNNYANSFSMAKSLTSVLIGCALKDGYIKSIDDAVAKYLPAFNDEEKKAITIRHLLTMSSGIDFHEAYVSPFAWPAEAYYGSDVNALTLKAEVIGEPGKQWLYKGGDSQLLGMILNRVTKKSVAEYASEKLWKPMGAEHPSYWSTDEKGMEKVSCCWYSNARDFARLAKLMLNKGNWNGHQIIDTAFVNESISPTNLMDEDGNPNDKYGFQWWLMKYKGHSIFYARGIRGQYIFGVPDLNAIIVRIGHKRAPKAGHNVPKDVFVYLDAAFSLIN